jgi:hypothetical protein
MFYVITKLGRVPAFLTDDEGEPMEFLSASQAERTAHQHPLCEAMGYVILDASTASADLWTLE